MVCTDVLYGKALSVHGCTDKALAIVNNIVSTSEENQLAFHHRSAKVLQTLAEAMMKQTGFFSDVL